MNKTRIKSFFKEFRQIMLPMKTLTLEALSTKPGMIGIAVVLVLVLTISLTTCSRKEPVEEFADAPAETQLETAEPAASEPAVTEPQIVGIPATMGTVTTDNLSICKDAGFVIDEDSPEDIMNVLDSNDADSDTYED